MNHNFQSNQIEFHPTGDAFNDLELSNLIRLSNHSSQLEIDIVQKSNEGIFRCEASSSRGESISKEIRLRIECEFD